MKFSKKAEYAVILCSELAFCDKNRSLREIAGHCEISYAFLRKVAHLLAEAKIVAGEEGKNGGYRLEKPADEVTLREILVAAGESMAHQPCCDGSRDCSGSAVCPRNSILFTLQSAVDEMFGSLTLDRMLKGEGSCLKLWKGL